MGVGVGVGGGMIGGTTGGGVFWAPVGAAGPVPAAPVPVPVPVPAAGGLEVSVCRGTMPACAAWARKRKKRLESSNDRESFMAEKDGQLRAEKRLDVKKIEYRLGTMQRGRKREREMSAKMFVPDDREEGKPDEEERM